MPFLFTYGTLQDPEVQRYVFGRTITGRVDTLPGFKWFENAVYGRYPLVRPTQITKDLVKGMVYQISSDDLERCDAYETSAYQRKRFTLTSGLTAWVYIANEVPAESVSDPTGENN